MHCYSSFWLAYAIGLIALSPAFADRDSEDRHAQAHSLEDADMRTWLRLSDSEHASIVEGYYPLRMQRTDLVAV